MTTETSDYLGKLINVKEIATSFREGVKSSIAADFGGKGPTLVAFLANDDSASKSYAERTQRACKKDGIDFKIRSCDKMELEKKIQEANRDPDVHGIMVYYPAFGCSKSFYQTGMDDYLRDTISYKKDVEGLCHIYKWNLFQNRGFLDPPQNTKKCILPCTPLAVVKILEYLKVYDLNSFNDKLSGICVTIINRSAVFGRPLATMLANDGATVISIDIESTFEVTRSKKIESKITVEAACKSSRIIITGVPTEAYKIPVDWIQPGAIVINVSSYNNVDKEEILKIPNVIYVPKVGKVTVAILERNLLLLYRNFHTKKSHPSRSISSDYNTIMESDMHQSVKIKERITWSNHIFEWTGPDTEEYQQILRVRAMDRKNTTIIILLFFIASQNIFIDVVCPPGSLVTACLSTILALLMIYSWYVQWYISPSSPKGEDGFYVAAYGGKLSWLTSQSLVQLSLFYAASAIAEIANLFSIGGIITQQLLLFCYTTISYFSGLGLVLTILFMKLVWPDPAYKDKRKMWANRGVPFGQIQLYTHCHTLPFALLDILFIKNKRLLWLCLPSLGKVLLYCLLYSLLYNAQCEYYYLHNGGYWPYDFQKKLNTIRKKLLFFLAVFILVGTNITLCWVVIYTYGYLE